MDELTAKVQLLNPLPNHHHHPLCVCVCVCVGQADPWIITILSWQIIWMPVTSIQVCCYLVVEAHWIWNIMRGASVKLARLGNEKEYRGISAASLSLSMRRL